MSSWYGDQQYHIYCTDVKPAEQHHPAAFRSKLEPSQHTWDFVDAPHESGPAWGLDIFFPAPNFTFWQSIDPGDIAQTHEWLLSHLGQQREPYDAILCFSQGCAVVSSLILNHSNEHPEEPLPFKAAVFICGGVPLAFLSQLGLAVPPAAWDINNSTGKQLLEKAGAAGAEIKALLSSGDVRDLRKATKRGLWDRTDGLSHQVQVPGDYDPLRLPPSLPRSNVYGLDYTQFPRCLKINIPTVHIYGIMDPRYTSSIQLAHFCDENKRRVYDHGGGHDIPKTTKVSAQIAELLRWLQKMVEEQEYYM